MSAPLIKRFTGDIFTSTAEAILVSVDGVHSTHVGALGQQLIKKIDDAREWKRLIEQVRYPIPAGHARVMDLQKVPEAGFKYAVLVCMFNHYNKSLYLRQGFHNALAVSFNWGIRSLATVATHGGWRGDIDGAEEPLIQACAEIPEVAVELWERVPRTTAETSQPL